MEVTTKQGCVELCPIRMRWTNTTWDDSGKPTFYEVEGGAQ